MTESNESLRAQVADLYARIEVQEGQGHALRTVIAALLTQIPQEERSAFAARMDIMFRSLHQALANQRFPHSAERTRANQSKGATMAQQALGRILDDWLPPGTE